MGRNGDQQLAMFQIFIAEAVILRAEDERDFAFLCCADNLRRDFPRSLAVAAVKSGPAGRADDQRAVGDCAANRFVALSLGQNIPAMHGHGSRPEALRARLADDGQLFGADILHRARDRADVAGAARANHDYTEIAQHRVQPLKRLERFTTGTVR